jgi:hypothetical protein
VAAGSVMTCPARQLQGCWSLLASSPSLPPIDAMAPCQCMLPGRGSTLHPLLCKDSPCVFLSSAPASRVLPPGLLWHCPVVLCRGIPRRLKSMLRWGLGSSCALRSRSSRCAEQCVPWLFSGHGVHCSGLRGPGLRCSLCWFVLFSAVILYTLLFSGWSIQLSIAAVGDSHGLSGYPWHVLKLEQNTARAYHAHLDASHCSLARHLPFPILRVLCSLLLLLLAHIVCSVCF